MSGILRKCPGHLPLTVLKHVITLRFVYIIMLVLLVSLVVLKRAIAFQFVEVAMLFYRHHWIF